MLGAAALLGRSFDWELLPGIAEVDGKAAVDGLRAAVDQQLIEVDGVGFRFRHALTREAVLHDLLPPERRDLASRAWPAHERANPGLPGATLELAADLAEAAGEPRTAARHLVESARRARDNGALISAEATARRAVRLAAGDPEASFDADEVLVDVLLAAGKPGEALALGQDLAPRLGAAGVPAARQADLLIVTARAALAAGDGPGATRHAAAAREAAGDAVDQSLAARLDGLAAEVALDQADLERRRSSSPSRRWTAPPPPASPRSSARRCSWSGTWSARGRGWKPPCPRTSRRPMVAAEHGLAQLHLRAQQETALVVWTRGDLQPLFEVRDLAARYGALITVAVMDLSLADIALVDLRPGRLPRRRDRVRGGEPPLRPRHRVRRPPLAGRRPRARRRRRGACRRPSTRRSPTTPTIRGSSATSTAGCSRRAAFVDDDLDRLPALLDTMIDHVRVAPPTTSVYPGRILWALLHTIDDDDLGVAARAEFAEAGKRVGLVLYDSCGEIIEAVALGRQGDAGGRGGSVRPRLRAAAHARRSAPGSVHCHAARRRPRGHPRRLGRPGRAGCGRRRRSSRPAATTGSPAAAASCSARPGRRCPGAAGATSEVPASLRALGVTSREVDVLKLVVAGRTNKEIADRAVPVAQDRRAAPVQPVRPHSAWRNRQALAERGPAAHLGDAEP